MHLVIDGQGGDARELGNPQIVEGLLRRLPGMMGMKVLTEARVIETDGGDNPERWGVSGDVMIEESHIHVHTFPAYGFVAFDAASCKDFDRKAVEHEVVETFALMHWRPQIVERVLDTLLTKPPAGVS